tara:strand:- start:1762 stop:2850 length:1089 start_codon:yes stop_codon:yes gene_type:complete
MAEISFKNVSKNYGQTKALNNVSFTCKEGEFFSIFGPSGAGKTTCLELIAGIKGEYSGDIYLGDQNINSLSVQDRNISMAFENYSLYPHFTVFENIVFPLKSPRAKSRSYEEILEIVNKNAVDLGISHLLDRNPSQLSGGQKQRVSLARALVREPNAFLLDEPIAHLDAKLRTVARANLKEIAQRLGTTIVYVTHDYREALALSDTILLLREGKIEQIGSPKDLWNSPKSDFVAHMIGDPVMNLIDGEILEDGGKYFLLSKHVKLEIPKKYLSKNKLKHKNVRLGIRPNDLSASEKTNTNGDIKGKVYGFERKSNFFYVHMMLGDTFIVARSFNDKQLSVGAEISISFDFDRVFFFEKTFEL